MVVGGIALLLIGVGGWDVFQERAALQDRINELEKSQARTRESEAVDAKTVADTEVENAALKLELDTLYQDYNAAMAQLSNMPDNVEATGDSDDAQETVAPSEPPTALAAQDGEPQGNEESEAAAPETGGWFYQYRRLRQRPVRRHTGSSGCRTQATMSPSRKYKLQKAPPPTA